MSELRQNVVDAITNPRTALSVSASTAGAGLSEMFLNIPWPAIATVIGSLLSILLGIVQLWKFIIDRRIRLLEEKILKHKIKDGFK